MGYTHYWTFRKPAGIPAAELEKNYQQAVKDCVKVIKEYQKNALGSDRLSGYSAHTKPGQYGGVNVNGKQDNAHEPFTLPEHFSDNFKLYVNDGSAGMSGAFNFCKTARKPYDMVVVACLSILKYRLGDAVDVSSDGTIEDWSEGVLWARVCLKRAIPNPLNTSEESKAFYKKLGGQK
jgi:hypothetical protein